MELQGKGAQNINLVSGTQFVPAIIRALELAKPSIPVVWNSSGYESAATIGMLGGYVQIYLPDFKYADDALGLRVSGVRDYSKTSLAALKEMVHQVGPVVLDVDGRMKSGVMVRHLILPGHVDNTLFAIQMLAEQFTPEQIWVSLMSQYTPCVDNSEMPELNRTVTTYEIKKAQKVLFDSGFVNGYVQDKCAAKKDFIPEFDGTGVWR